MTAVRHHVIISGTGRAGTTFLVQLLTRLGLDTGFGSDKISVPLVERAGLETIYFSAEAPYIVKSPLLCDYIGDVLSNPDIQIDHAIIPVRAFEGAAASRAYVQRLATGHSDGQTVVPGGLWHTETAAEQETVLRLQFTKLIEELVRHDIPTTLLWYPRLVRDPDYLYEKLAFLLAGYDPLSFRETFERTQNASLVHQFTPTDI